MAGRMPENGSCRGLYGGSGDDYEGDHLVRGEEGYFEDEIVCA
jgi:hypothetical protein